MDVDEWGCSVAWMPMLLVENSQQQRSTGAAVESFRNESVKGNQQNQQLYIHALQQQAMKGVQINTIEEGKNQ